jgi:hypothetical protein
LSSINQLDPIDRAVTRPKQHPLPYIEAAIMRLVNTRELKLKSFSDYKVLKYAILSHTWEEEEVTLQDMETDRGTTLLGY